MPENNTPSHQKRKTRINVTIDLDTFLRIKTMDLNVSKAVNNFLTNLVRIKEDTREESEIQNHIDNIDTNIDKLQTERSALAAELETARNIREQKRREADKIAERMRETVIANNPLRDA